MKRCMIGMMVSAAFLSACGGGGGGSGARTEYILFAGNTAPEPVRNWELWQTDGTMAGTRLLRDLNDASGGVSTSVTEQRWMAGTGFFVADDGVHGRELWTSDGTASGTRMVRDIRPGSSHAGIDSLYLIEGVVYFDANDGESGNELWRSDGTAAGTRQLVDLVPAGCSSAPGDVHGAGNIIYFLARAECEGPRVPWRLDLSTGTAVQLYETQGYISRLENVAERVFFVEQRDGRSQLWVSFGTAEQTYPVVVDEQGTQAEVHYSLWRLGASLFFAALNRDEGVELYRVDETGRRASLVRDIAEGAASSNPFSFSAIDGVGYFAADDGEGQAVWRTDGTAQGTHRVTDPAIVGPGDIYNIRAYGDRFLFTVEHAGQRSLWSTDGTQAGTLQLLNDPLVSSISQYRQVNGWLLFSALHDQYGNEMWRTDGTPEGTVMIQDLCPGPCNGY